MGLNKDEIILKLTDLAEKHKATGDNIDDYIFFELIESEAEELGSAGLERSKSAVVKV